MPVCWFCMWIIPLWSLFHPPTHTHMPTHTHTRTHKPTHTRTSPHTHETDVKMQMYSLINEKKKNWPVTGFVSMSGSSRGGRVAATASGDSILWGGKAESVWLSAGNDVAVAADWYGPPMPPRAPYGVVKDLTESLYFLTDAELLSETCQKQGPLMMSWHWMNTNT